MGMNIVVPNSSNPNSDLVSQWIPVWRLTRAMKAAGWVYLGSSDGISANGKEVTGNPVLDRWGPGGIVTGHSQLGSQTGSAAITQNNPTSFYITITGLTGMTSASVGHALTLSGSSSTYYNGTFTIVGYTSSTEVTIFNPNIGTSQPQETGLTWSERVSGAASITWSDLSNGFEQTITGLSNITSNSAGHYIKLEGSANSNNNGYFQILSYVSSSSVIIINNNSGAASDTSSGYWIELDPLLDVCPNNTTLHALNSWIVFQGPSTLRIPISAASTGTFIKGELITESVSGAQGELLGYQWDTDSSIGHVIVKPRKNGAGAGVKGWSIASTTLTGVASSATVTTANPHTPQEFVREVVFHRITNANAGGIHYQVVDSSTESTSRFSYLMTQTGCAYNVYPGGGGTNNAYPALGTYAVKYNANWFCYNATVPLGKHHIMAVNAHYRSAYSADGSFTLAVGYPGANTGAFIGFGFHILENTEEGDVDPYVWMVPNSAAVYSEVRGPTTTVGVPPNAFDYFSIGGQNNATYWKGFRRRGFSTGDYFQNFTLASLSPISSAAANLIYVYTYDNDRVATSLSSNPPKIRDPLWVVSAQTLATVAGQPFGKMRKGILRWAFLISGGNSCDTYDDKQWIQLSSANGPWVFGPWDGVTQPFQT